MWHALPEAVRDLDELVDIEPALVQPPHHEPLALLGRHLLRRTPARRALRRGPVSSVLVLPADADLEAFAALATPDVDYRGCVDGVLVLTEAGSTEQSFTFSYP